MCFNRKYPLTLYHFLLFGRCLQYIFCHTFCMVTLLRKFPRLRPCRPNGRVFQFLIRWKTIFIFSFSILSSKITPKEHLRIINFAIRILYQITNFFFFELSNCQTILVSNILRKILPVVACNAYVSVSLPFFFFFFFVDKGEEKLV